MLHMQFWDPGLWQELCAAQMGYPIAHSNCQVTTGDDEKKLRIKNCEKIQVHHKTSPKTSLIPCLGNILNSSSTLFLCF